jgi:hypothetical protein
LCAVRSHRLQQCDQIPEAVPTRISSTPNQANHASNGLSQITAAKQSVCVTVILCRQDRKQGVSLARLRPCGAAFRGSCGASDATVGRSRKSGQSWRRALSLRFDRQRLLQPATRRQGLAPKTTSRLSVSVSQCGNLNRNLGVGINAQRACLRLYPYRSMCATFISS